MNPIFEALVRRRRYGALIVAVGLLVTSAACSLILDNDTQQCATDGDCSGYAAGAVCRDSVCVSGLGATEGGADAFADSEGGTCDGGPCQKGGFAGDPTTNDQFLNRCTVAQCVAFDNCDRLGICDGGLPGTQAPDGGGGAAPPGPDSGATDLCTTLAAALPGAPGIVYATGSSNFPPFLKAFAPVLAKSNYVVAWQTSNSCEGVNKAFNVDPLLRTMKERPGRQTDLYLPDGNTTPCLLSGEMPVDVGESDIYAKTCAATIGYDPNDVAVSTGVGEYLGPAMAMVFIVPGSSSQTALSAEAAQSVFGRGGVPMPGKLPYDEPVQIFTRASSTATNQIISLGIFVPPTLWWGVDKRTASNMATQMKQVPANLAEKTIGIISTDFADSERGNLKTLAFQARGQSCGFWPDSTPFAEDKQNVRDGHYPLWGPLHFFTRLNAGVPSAAAGAFVLRFSVPRLDQELIKSIAESANIPECAMQVTRTEEMGAIKPFDPPFRCGCYFDSLTKGTTTCKACASPNECPTDRPACNYGFCEAH